LNGREGLRATMIMYQCFVNVLLKASLPLSQRKRGTSMSSVARPAERVEAEFDLK